MSLRNAATALMAGLDFVKGYQYDPDQAGGVALTQTCFPEEIGEQDFYQPTENGLALRLKEKLDDLKGR